MKLLVYLLAGVIFGIGLTISQMVDPMKVLNFLSITESWDPSLAFVMVGAIGLFSISRIVFTKNNKVSIFGDVIGQKISSVIDKKLVVGSILFGVGWGITGLCPGPAVANISNLDPKILVFILVMIISMRISHRLK
ncbi:MAG: DUF6691 family protein [Kangiellaceae bacterium]|jgi:uncharacterized protein